ncbi:MAG: ABC-F family ATP-binding cassette domain-containing protein [Lapillicoccus sp.]
MTAAQQPGSTSLLPLVATDVVRTFGDRVVLDGVGLIAHPGQPVGLVGENGVGKSTLLLILAGLDRPDGGAVSAPADLAYLGQEAEMDPGATVGEGLHAALAPLHQAVARLEGLAGRLAGADPDTAAEYATALAWAEHHDAWDADRRAELAAAHLGLATVDRERPVTSLSGGERSRLALAAVVTRRPDAVLLDEPTNHLDDDAMAFLEDFLAACPGVVVVASHDRVFLDRVAEVVVDLDPSWFGADGRGGDRYTGDVTAYLAAKRAARRRWEQAFLDQREEIEALRVAAATTARRTAPGRGPRDGDKMAYDFKTGTVQRSVARRVRDVERRLDAVEAHRVPKPPRPLRLTARMSTGSGRVRVRGLVVPGRVRVDRLDLGRGQHLLVTGPNGSGKSSLLSVLAGTLAPGAGDVHVTARRIGHLPQDVTLEHPGHSAEEVYAAAVGDREVPPLRDLGLLHPRELGKPVGALSVGQRRRLALAVVVAVEPDLLLLDEPTNHISLALAGELEEALGTTAGTVVVTSHDRWLRARWEGPTLSLE